MGSDSGRNSRGGCALGAQFSSCFHQAGEGGRIVHAQVGEHLAVHFDFGGLEHVNQAAVRQTQLAGSGVDALDPEASEVALARATVAILVHERMNHGFFSRLVQAVPATGMAFREGEDFLMVGVVGNATFYTDQRTDAPIEKWGIPLLCVGKQTSNASLITR